MGIISGGGLSVFVLMALYQYYFPGDKAAETSTEPPTLELAGRIVSDTLTFAVLAVISVMAVYAIREIVRSEQRPKVKRAKYIATMIGLICVALLFKERFLDQLFIGQDVHSVVKVLLFGGAAAGGWFAWYLKQLKEYGEFFEVFLLTFVSGFAWYARFSPSDEVQWVAVAFVLSSLFRIGKDYIDSDRADAQAVAAKTKSV